MAFEFINSSAFQSDGDIGAMPYWCSWDINASLGAVAADLRDANAIELKQLPENSIVHRARLQALTTVAGGGSATMSVVAAPFVVTPAEPVFTGSNIDIIALVAMDTLDDEAELNINFDQWPASGPSILGLEVEVTGTVNEDTLQVRVAALISRYVRP